MSEAHENYQNEATLLQGSYRPLAPYLAEMNVVTT